MQTPEETDLTKTKKQAKKGAWSQMNRIQKGGVIIGLILMPFSFASGSVWNFLGFLSYTSLFTGYVAGSLWKVRHVLHFWWSTTIAFAAHCCLFPVYSKLLKAQNSTPGQGGKLYMYMMFGLMIAEVLISISVSKLVSAHMRKRAGRYLPERHESGPGSLLA